MSGGRGELRAISTDAFFLIWSN